MSEESKKEKKVKKPKSKARKIIEWVLTGIFLVLFAFVMAAQIDGMVHKKEHYDQQIRFGYGTFVVKTSSMEPKYKVNTALITYNDKIEDIVSRFNKGEEVDLTFMDAFRVSGFTPDNDVFTNATEMTGLPMTHRLREVHINEDKTSSFKYILVASGINENDPNYSPNQYQTFTEKEILGRVVVNSPFLGGIFSFVSTVWGLLILLLIPAFYLVISSVIDIFKAYKDPDEAKAEATSGGTPKAEVALSEADKKRLKEQLLEEMINKKKGENHEDK